MAKAKYVYAKIQKDLSDAQRERQLLDSRINDLKGVIAGRDKAIAAMMNEIRPWGEKLTPGFFAEKRRLETEVTKAVVDRERTVRSLTETYDNATKIYSGLYVTHQAFEQAETNKLLTNPDYIDGWKSIRAYNEIESGHRLDELTEIVDRHDKKLGDTWLIRAAYHNNFGKDDYVSQHFLQDLFGMLCLRVKKTRRYNRLTNDVEYSREALANARADADRRATDAFSASILIQRMKDATRHAIETHAQESFQQKEKVDAAGSAMDREMKALEKEKVRCTALKDWSHPVAKDAKDKFQNTLIEDSEDGRRLRSELSVNSAIASTVRNIMRESTQRGGELLTLSALNKERTILSNTIDKLESTSRDMRRKSLSTSSREIAKADDFMAGNSVDTGFDLSTLVAVALVIDTVIDSTPQDTSASSFSSDSYSSGSFD